jgi:uncharacterized protein
MSQKRYVPDLREMQSLAERNYAAAVGLLHAGYQVGDERELRVSDSICFTIRVLTDAPYTTDIQVLQNEQVSPYLQSSFTVRLYHDMQLAEMIDSQGLQRFAASYEQPNKNMHQRDEKRQVNRFLADWLRLCFSKGRWSDVAAIGNGMSFDFQGKR